jgi:hypothetical protein
MSIASSTLGSTRSALTSCDACSKLWFSITCELRPRHARDSVEVFVGLVVLENIGGDGLRDRDDQQRDRRRQRAGGNQLCTQRQVSELQPFHGR